MLQKDNFRIKNCGITVEVKKKNFKNMFLAKEKRKNMFCLILVCLSCSYATVGGAENSERNLSAKGAKFTRI